MENIAEIREYRHSDEREAIALLRLNTPLHFAPSEEAGFLRYLNEERELYYVLLADGKTVACGGINFVAATGEAKISWDMVHPEYQRRGLGRLLLRHRLAILRPRPDIRRITVRTSQTAYRFYEKEGFRLLETAKDYWAEGFDMYRMEYGLSR